MTPTQQKSIRKKILELIKNLEAKKPRDVAGTEDRLDDDMAPVEEMNQVIASNRNKNDAVVMLHLRKALARLDHDPDDFGNCRDCGDAIAVRRLEAMPWVELCVECQSKLDARGKKGPRKSTTDYVE